MQNTIPNLQSHNEKRTKAFNNTLLGIVGILLLLVGVGYATVRVGPYIPDAYQRISLALATLSQRFMPAKPAVLTLTASPESVLSGEVLQVSWTHENKRGSGIYSLSYPCTDGLSVSIENGVSPRTIECEKGFDITDISNAVSLSIHLTSGSNAIAFIPLSLSYTDLNDASASLQETITLSVTPDTAPVAGEVNITPEQTTTVTAPATPKTITAGNKTEKTYTINSDTPVTTTVKKTDLVPKIISVGVIDRITNAYTPTTTLMASARIAVKFEVENLGTADSGHWQFSAVLPTYPMHIFESEGQQSLAPGDKIEYTLGFDNVIADKDGDIVVNVDPTKSISEVSEDNNIVRITIHPVSK